MTLGECRAEVDALLAWLVRHDFSGHDPFDGLESRVFQALPLTRSAAARLAWIQLFKRSPVNLRSVALVPALRNPKTVGLVLTALARLRRARGHCPYEDADELISWLVENRSPSSAGWGYPFAWQNRAFYAPRHTPNAICTVFVVEGLLDYADATASDRARDLAVSALPFFLHELRRSGSNDASCFSYTALDQTRIHNVNLLVAAALARLTVQPGVREPEFLEEVAQAAVKYTVAAQREDGAWPYGDEPHQSWVDGFHTGFNLCALKKLEALADVSARNARARGCQYFRAYLLDPEGNPKYYDTSRFPIDVHACAQAIVTLLENADLANDGIQRSTAVAYWTRQTLGLGNGEYAYQRNQLTAHRYVYARWGQAWMLRALAELEAALC